MLSKQQREILKQATDNGLICGVQLAIPTGKVLEEDATYIEVLIYGKSVFAKPSMAFGSFNVPNKEWLDEYKDEVSVWVAFENGDPAHPVYLGVCPRDGKTPEGNYPRTKSWKSVEFEYIFDDKEKTFTLKHKDGAIWTIDGNSGEIEFKSKDGQGFKAKTETILGGGNGQQSAVLGEKNKDAILELSKKIDAIYQAISSAGVASMDGGATFKASLISALSGNGFPITPNVTTMAEQTLSEKVKLD